MLKQSVQAIVFSVAAFAIGAQAQTPEQRQSSEQMKPITKDPERKATPSMDKPKSAADKRAEDQQRSAEQMKPPGSSQAGAARSATKEKPQSEADRKQDAQRRASEQMKPQ